MGWHVKKLSARAAVWLLKSTGWYDGYYDHWRTFFDYGERHGLHLMPVHFYSPIPDTQHIDWGSVRKLPGVDLNLEKAEKTLRQLLPRYASECAKLPASATNPQQYSLDNPAFSRGDADVLYSLVRDYKPVRIVEVGSGYTTLLISQAIRESKKEKPTYKCKFTAIEPYPPDYLVPPPDEVTELRREPVQQAPRELFTTLKKDDILFIDSSHTVKTGGDTVHEILSILPLLAPGVLVHFHDIFTPFDYPKHWLTENRFFWTEQYLLEAFLSFNDRFEVMLPMNAIAKQSPGLIAELIPLFYPQRHGFGSFWLRRL